jgi:small subunit ribosomal protein S16
VVADQRAPRDGKYIEKIGSYNPMLEKSDEQRVVIDFERAKYWLETGAQPSETVAKFLRIAGIYDKAPTYTPKEKVEKLSPKQQARKEMEEAAKAKAEANAAAEAETPATEETASEETAEATEATEAPAEEAKVEEAMEEAPAAEETAEAAQDAAEESKAE